MNHSYLFILTGTSGSGRKTTAYRALDSSGVVHVPSCTDRPPRDKELPDGDYRYMTVEQFDILHRLGCFAQVVKIDRFRYGVMKRDLEYALSRHRSVYVIVNREGAEELRRKYGERAVRIFLYVDKRTVSERLEAKGLPGTVIDRYLSHYTEEVTYRLECEHVIENIHVGRTAERIRGIVESYCTSRESEIS